VVIYILIQFLALMCLFISTLFHKNKKDNLVCFIGEDYPSEGSSAPQHESSQEGAEFVSVRDESDESL
jgi:hypothetical protein